MLACKVLKRSGKERLREEETGDPEHLQYSCTENTSINQSINLNTTTPPLFLHPLKQEVT